jgi:hypothetical protein
MDLSTVKQKVPEYPSVTAALKDMRAIWENCRIFNAEGSDILASAETCSELMEELIVVRPFIFYV